MIANHWIRQPALLLLDRDQKFVMMGGADFHLVKKSALVCSSFICFCGCFEGGKKNFVSLRPPKIKTLLEASEMDSQSEAEAWMLQQNTIKLFDDDGGNKKKNAA